MSRLLLRMGVASLVALMCISSFIGGYALGCYETLKENYAEVNALKNELEGVHRQLDGAAEMPSGAGNGSPH